VPSTRKLDSLETHPLDDVVAERIEGRNYVRMPVGDSPVKSWMLKPPPSLLYFLDVIGQNLETVNYLGLWWHGQWNLAP